MIAEGELINPANLDDTLTPNNFSDTTFLDASTTLPAAPQVSGGNLVQLDATVNPLCTAYQDRYTFTAALRVVA